MTWVKNAHGVKVWHGEFVEPSDANLAGYGNRHGRTIPTVKACPGHEFTFAGYCVFCGTPAPEVNS